MTTKRPFPALLSLALLLLLFSFSVQAQDLDIPLEGNSTVLLDSTFYTLASDQHGKRSLMAYTLGDAEPRTICQLPPQPEHIPHEDPYEDYPKETRDALENLVDAIFVNNGQLHAINHCTGRIGTLDEQGVHWGDFKIDNSPYFEGGNLRVYARGFTQDNCYINTLTDYDMETDLESITLFISDLTSGATRTIKTHLAASVDPYRPGSLLILRAVPEGAGYVWQLAELDLATEAITPLPMALPRVNTEGENALGAIGYDPQLDAYYYATPNKLFMSRAKGPFEPTAILALNHIAPGQSRGIPLPDSHYAVPSWEGTFIRKTGNTLNLGNSLTIKGNFMEFGIKARFHQQSPGTALFLEGGHLTAADAGQLVRNGDAETDLFALQADPALYALLQKGYAAPLTNDKLLTAIGSMYPAAQQVLLDREGRPSAFPISFNLSSGFIVREHWQQYMGDTPYPETFLDLFDAMLGFNKRHASEDPEAYFLFDTDEEGLLRAVIQGYIRQYESQEGPLDFNSPVLKDTLLKMTEALAVAKAAGQGPQEFVGESSGDSRNAPSLVHLFSGGGNPFAVPDTFGNHHDPVPPFAFQAGEEHKQPGWLQVMVINPNSSRQDLAQQFLEIYLNPQTDPRTYYALRPDANQPLPNPNYEEAIQRTQADLAKYTKALEDAKKSGTASSEDLRVYQFRIDSANQDLADQDRLKYVIQQEGIDRFRQIAPTIRYFTDSRLLDNGPAQAQLETHLQRYLSGEAPVDTFLKDLTEMARLVFMESR